MIFYLVKWLKKIRQHFFVNNFSYAWNRLKHMYKKLTTSEEEGSAYPYLGQGPSRSIRSNLNLIEKKIVDQWNWISLTPWEVIVKFRHTLLIWTSYVMRQWFPLFKLSTIVHTTFECQRNKIRTYLYNFPTYILDHTQ